MSSRVNTIVLACLVAGVAACTPIAEQRGTLPDPDAIASIKPGMESRNAVFEKLGPPSNIATFDDKTWYYIATRIETVAFYEPNVVDQQVVAISFDDSGVVESVRRYGLDDARDIDPVDRITPTSGKSLTFLQQMLGNIGRFAQRNTKKTPQ